MSYQSAMEAAGATVLCFEQFGSYQGEWWAKVTHNGKTGWVNGYYGSCSGCDAFEAEIGYCDENEPDYQRKLSAFGAEYLDQMMTHDEALTCAKKNIEWDLDAEAMVDFIKANA